MHFRICKGELKMNYRGIEPFWMRMAMMAVLIAFAFPLAMCSGDFLTPNTSMNYPPDWLEGGYVKSFDRSETIQRHADRINDPAGQGIPNRQIQSLPRPPHRSTRRQPVGLVQQDRTDARFRQIVDDGPAPVVETQYIVHGHRRQALDPGDAVADRGQDAPLGDAQAQ